MEKPTVEQFLDALEVPLTDSQREQVRRFEIDPHGAYRSAGMAPFYRWVQDALENLRRVCTERTRV